MQQPPPGGFGGPPPQGGPQYPQYQYPPQQQYQQQYPQQQYQQQQQYGPMMPMPGVYTSGYCPRCNSPYISHPSFTWWGGLIGPKLLNHASCNSCQLGFNSKTGKSNTGPIAIYMGVIFGLCFMIFVLRVLAH